MTALEAELATLRSEIDVLRTALEDCQTTMAAMREERRAAARVAAEKAAAKNKSR